jgi:hypothetical protein
MAYNKRPSSSSALPGSSIKGAGALPPGVYTGYFETKRLPGNQTQQTFAAMPHGFHISGGEEYAVTVKLSPGCALRRTDGGRVFMVDVLTGEAMTGMFTDVHEMLAEAAQKKLKLTSPEIVLVQDMDGHIVYKKENNNV